MTASKGLFYLTSKAYKFSTSENASFLTFLNVQGPVLGARHLQTFLLFLAITISYAARHNISVSLVAMTDKKTTNPNFQEFNWNEKQKSYLLSSFSWGYVLSQIPGGYAARKFGVRMTIFVNIFMNSILSFSVPFFVTWGDWPAFFAVRALQGLCEGTLFPCVYQHLAKWSPLNERNLLGSLSHKGIECGIFLAMFVTGLIAASEWGWPGISYVFGGSGIVISFIWLIFAENTPEKAKFITSSERNYIILSRKPVEEIQQTKEKKENIPIPWRAILTSGPFLSLLVVRLCEGWSFSTLLAQTPAYLHGIFKMSIKNNAFYSALPYVGMLFTSLVFMIVADVLIKRKWVSLLVLRKSFSTIAMWGVACFLTIIGFLNEDQQALAIICFTLAVSVASGVIIGNLMNLIDLSPNHTGILMAIANTFTQMVPIICPIVVGRIVVDETDRSQWQIVYLIAAGLLFLGNLQFLVFAQTDAQPWNDEDYMKKRNNEKGIKTSAVSSL